MRKRMHEVALNDSITTSKLVDKTLYAQHYSVRHYVNFVNDERLELAINVTFTTYDSRLEYKYADIRYVLTATCSGVHVLNFNVPETPSYL